jgi:NUMOD3 motif
MPGPKGNFVYALSDPRTGAIRYVGKAQGYLNSRFRRHLWEARATARHTHKLAWLRQLQAAGLEPTLTILQELPSHTGLAEAECAWILRLQAEGAPLVNATPGGEGMPDPSPETRAKLRQRPQVGWTPRAWEAASAARSAKAAEPEQRAAVATRAAERARQRASLLSALGPEGYAEWKRENARKMGDALRGMPKTPEHRAKLAAASTGLPGPMAGRTHSEETRAKMRAAWVRRKAGQHESPGPEEGTGAA